MAVETAPTRDPFALSEEERTVMEAHAEIGYRIGTMSGEQYWFKEFDLATSRLLRGSHEFMDLLHPADGVGDLVDDEDRAVVLGHPDQRLEQGVDGGRRVGRRAGHDRAPERVRRARPLGREPRLRDHRYASRTARL